MSLISGKKGKLYFKFLVAIALIAAAIYSYAALAANPSATPIISNTNGTAIGSTQIANASIARANDQLFGGGAL